VYIDKEADLQKAIDVVVDSKTNYPAACNSTETLLVHADVVNSHLLEVARALPVVAKNVTLKCDEPTYKVLNGSIDTKYLIQSQPTDYDTEFLELMIAVKQVSSVNEAISHINSHGSHHTDSIITENKSTAELFMNSIDAAGVYWNASTRFADGFRYGFGAEIGVSTSKIHARGPCGLESLVIYKYKLYGNGHCVDMYGAGKRSYKHGPIV
jgi:glutamate-5-semialdehyde dehydrogenase